MGCILLQRCSMVLAGLCLLVVAGQVQAESSAGRWIELRTAYSTTFSAYESGPVEAPAGLLIAPDIWGVDATVRDWADRLGRLGIHVLAVDVYDGRMVTNTVMAREVYRSIDPVWIREDLKGGLRYLAGQGHDLAVLGWGKGALAAARLLTEEAIEAPVRAVLVYDDVHTAGRIAGLPIALPVFEVTTHYSLVDPDHPPRPSDLESTWQATERFLRDRLGLAAP